MSTSPIRRLGPIAAAIGLALGLFAADTADAAVTKNAGPVYALPGLAEVEGASVNARITGGGANLSIQTSGLTPGSAYTLRSISFSNPDECQNGMDGRLCGPGDHGPGPQGFAVNFVGGHMVGNSGQLTISGQVDVDHAAGAEYHLVVANHGPKDPSELPGQIKTPGPGVQIGFLVPNT